MTTPNEAHFTELFQKYEAGLSTPEETEELFALIKQGEHEALLQQLSLRALEETAPTADYDEVGWNGVFNRLMARAGKQENTGRTSRRLWPRVAVAAAIILMAGAGIFYEQHQTVEPLQQMAQSDIKPGSNKAFLTLANGTRIMLTGAKNGALAKQLGVQITKSANGQLTYTATGMPINNSTAEYNTVETPKGGQYQIRLPDGTKVWLNAASSIKYPAYFASLKTRTVELTGEAYFEVAKDKGHPFIVRTAKEDVTVLGTHFNVNAYADEPVMKTTLLEGSVKVTTAKDSKLIVPGENAILNNGSLSIAKANVEEAVAWKNGYFRFNGESLESVMRRLSRWYDIDVQYDNRSDEVFYGKVSRFTKIEDVLSIMEGTKGVRFKIKGRRVIITK